MTREANSKAEQSITPDQQKKLQDKVDKCKQDVQKVRVTSLKRIDIFIPKHLGTHQKYSHCACVYYICLDTFTLLLFNECGVKAAYNIRKYVCILVQVHLLCILYFLKFSLTLNQSLFKRSFATFLHRYAHINIPWLLYIVSLIFCFAIYSHLSWYVLICEPLVRIFYFLNLHLKCRLVENNLNSRWHMRIRGHLATFGTKMNGPV